MAHYLIVTEPEPGYFEHTVQHEESCPTIKEYFTNFQPNDFSDERPFYIRETCDIGECIDWSGFVDLEDDLKFNIPGKHEIDFYSYWSDSMFEDSEAYLYFVEN